MLCIEARQPPCAIKYAIFSIVRVEKDSMLFTLLNKSFKDTEPFESSDSYKLIDLINNLEILPVPVCDVILSFGTADPVNINCPVSFLLFTSNLTVSQRTGETCYSLSNLGISP